MSNSSLLTDEEIEARAAEAGKQAVVQLCVNRYQEYRDQAEAHAAKRNWAMEASYLRMAAMEVDTIFERLGLKPNEQAA